MKLVMKFGGSSVADAESIKHVAKIIANYAEKNRIIVVVSALKDVTNQLIASSEKARSGNRKAVKELIRNLRGRHLTTTREAIENSAARKKMEKTINKRVRELDRALTGIIYLGELTPKSRDYVLSFGEQLSAPIVWGALRSLGLKAQHFTGKEAGIVTDSNFGEAMPLLDLTKKQVKAKLNPLLAKGVIPVVTGFIAATRDGTTTTIGRGGSDYTATIVAASISADEVWIWTDVDGLMTTDPKIIPKAKRIPEVSFAEAIEMAVLGAKSMHPRALEPIMEADIPVRIRNTFNLENPGTLIIKEQKIKPGDIVKALNIVKDVAMITVGGAGMMGTPGTAAKVFDALGRNGINILMISQSVSETNISLIIKRSQLKKAVAALETALLGKGIVREITAEGDVCIIAAVGAGMKGTPGVAAKIFDAVARRGVNIRMIAQGSSELNISFVVKEAQSLEAAQALHEEFKLS